MKASHASIVIVAAVLGVGARARHLHVRLCARLGVHDRRPARLRELPRHERAVRRLDQEQPPLGRRVQRLSRAPQLSSPSTATKARNGFWHSYYFTTRHVPRADPGAAGEPGHRGGELPPLPRAGRPGDGHAGTRRIPRHLVHPLPRIRRPHGASPRPTSRSLRGEPCPTRNAAEFAAGVAVPS